MSTETSRHSPASLAVYTSAPWESAVVVLRITGPAEFAGFEVIKGNHGPQVSPELVSDADMVVIQRDFPRFWSDYKRVIDEARFDNKPVLYDLDDLLVEIPDQHSHSGDYIGELLAMLYAILEADVVTASSSPLVDYLSELNPNTKLVNNYLNDQLWAMVEPKVSGSDDQKITIGYMGGQTHKADLAEVADPLLTLSEKYTDRLEFRFWGVQPPPELLNSPSTEWINLNQEDYAEFARFFTQQDCDVLIAPLEDNEFNQSKSSLKFLEYSTLGVPGVYSKLPPYEAIVEHGDNGYLASSPQDWEKYLSKLIENPSLRNKLAVQAQQTVKDQWLLSQKYTDWSRVYHQALSGDGIHDLHSRKHDHLMKIISQAEDYQAGLENSLYEVGNQLNDIINSRSWHIMKSIQNLRMKIVPKGSALEQILFGRDQSL
jgi:hypothetical protein